MVEGFHREDGGSFGDPWVDLVSRLVQSDRRWNRFHLVDVFRFHSLQRTAAEEVRTRAAEPLSDRSVLAMQIATRCPKRTWGEEGFVEVARSLQRDVGCEILLLGEARERKQAEHIVGRAGCGRLRDLMGKTSLEDLVQILASCDRLLSGDTGTLHLAAYLGVPSLGIYLGPAYVFETGPYGPGHLVLQADPRCGPCSEEAACERDTCRTGIRPESVLQLLKGEPASLRTGVGVYTSGFVEGWLQYGPVRRRQATREDVIGFLYLGSAAAYLSTPPGRLPSLAGAFRFLLDHYEVSRTVLRTVWDSLEASLPLRMRSADRQSLLGILRRGWTQLREMHDGCVAQEPGCPATAAA
jgi:Glycosyltransferase family 9 (heptosyltransferase)